MENKDFAKQWETAKQTIRKDYPHVKDEDLAYEIGKEEEMLERLETKVGKTREEIRNWLHIMG
ncbi:MAG: general stress protein CsbD [Sphingobacteriales bacterium]|nr:MAG: general stress protein CsbD [Sphingobacteriales bacterium]